MSEAADFPEHLHQVPVSNRRPGRFSITRTMVAGLLASAGCYLVPPPGGWKAGELIAAGIFLLAGLALFGYDMSRRRHRPVLYLQGRAIGVYRARRLAGVVGPGSLILTELDSLTTVKMLVPLALLAFLGFVVGGTGADLSPRERATLLIGSAFLAGLTVSIGWVRHAWVHITIRLPDNSAVAVLLDWSEKDVQELVKE